MNIKINQFELKLIAIFVMTIDHIAWIFVATESFLGQLMHFLGRLTAPIMCYFLAQGYRYSKDKKSYALRLSVFALLAQVPYSLMIHGYNQVFADFSLLIFQGNILFNLLIALFSLMLLHTCFSWLLKVAVLSLLFYLSTFLDWGIYIITFSLVLYYSHNDKKTQFYIYTITAMGLLLLADRGYNPAMPSLSLNWFPLGILIAPFTWYIYDGTLGSRWGGRYFFYAFYPVHILILVSLAILIDKI